MKLSELKLLENNPRFMAEESLDRLCRSIKRDPEFMVLRPIVYDPSEGNRILGGNQRYKACLKLGMDEIPDEWTRSAQDLTEEQKRRFVIVDNAPEGMSGTWDLEVLSNNWIDVGLTEIGFDPVVIQGLTGIEEGDEPREDQEFDQSEKTIDSLQDKWQVKPGNVYQIGRHRLMCGDATIYDHVKRLLDGETPGIMVTDPPYGVEYDPEWRSKRLKEKCSRAEGDVANDDTIDWQDAWSLFDGDVAYIWCASIHYPEVLATIEKAGFVLRNVIVWNKSHFAISRGDYHWKHELCIYAVREGKPSQWGGARDQTTVWDIAKPQKNDTGHSTQKPLECMARPMRNHDFTTIYDPFVGSGTSLESAEIEGKTCYAMELNPRYVAVCLERMLVNCEIEPELV